MIAVQPRLPHFVWLLPIWLPKLALPCGRLNKGRPKPPQIFRNNGGEFDRRAAINVFREHVQHGEGALLNLARPGGAWQFAGDMGEEGALVALLSWLAGRIP